MSDANILDWTSIADALVSGRLSHVKMVQPIQILTGSCIFPKSQGLIHRQWTPPHRQMNAARNCMRGAGGNGEWRPLAAVQVAVPSENAIHQCEVGINSMEESQRTLALKVDPVQLIKPNKRFLSLQRSEYMSESGPRGGVDIYGNCRTLI